MKKQILKSVLSVIILFGSYANGTAQTDYTEIYPNYKVPITSEKINVSQYNSKYKGSILDYTETKPDGTQIQVKSYRRNSEIEVFERPPHPAIHTIYKAFYPNGRLKTKGVLLPLQVQIGKWIECDAAGNCTITDYESGRGKFTYNDVLEYLEFDGIYNQQDGNNWKCTFWHTPQNHIWGVRIDKNGQQYKMLEFDTNGERDVKETELTGNTNSAPVVGTFEQTEE